jgi:hypothetical protein
MAAIRKNERSGPGMDTSSAVEELSRSADCCEGEFDELELFAGAGGMAAKELKQSPLHKTDRKQQGRNKDLVRRDFMAQTSTDRWRR